MDDLRPTQPVEAGPAGACARPARFLVIVRAGRKSLHPAWLAPSAPFTLLVTAYEPLPAPPSGVLYRDVPGTKVAGYAALFAAQPDLLEDYTHIALIDDDIETTAQDIARCFSLGVTHNLDIWQPSLSWRSYFSYAIFLHNPVTRLRYCNFIEMMCPFFTAEALKRALPLFHLGVETGIDLFWCHLAESPVQKYAVIDKVRVTHTRPVGTTAVQQGFAHGYDEVFKRLARERGVAFHGPVAYALILKSGQKIMSRIACSLAALLTLGALISTPARKKFCAMRILDHIRHNLTRPIDNDRITL